MKINHNIPALKTLNSMASVNSKVSKTMERLSTGLRINGAADDAAGLAIAQKMDTQVRGLKQANRNTMDGISLIQTAEGALNEVQSMLQRMRELAVQASNDTYQDADRKQIQLEIEQLKEEINNVANNTEFNKKKLIDGSFSKEQPSEGTQLELGVDIGTGKILTGTGTAPSISTASSMTLEIQLGDIKKSVVIPSGSYTAATLADAINASIQKDAYLKDKVSADVAGTGELQFTSKTNDQFMIIPTADSAHLNITGIVGSAPIEGIENTTKPLKDLGDKGGNGFGLTAGDKINISFKQGEYTSISGSKNVEYTVKPGDTMQTLLREIAKTMQLPVVEPDGNVTTFAADGTPTTTTVPPVTPPYGYVTMKDGKIIVSGEKGVTNAISDLKISVEGKEEFTNVLSSYEETRNAQDAKTDHSLALQVGANENQVLKINIKELSTKGLMLDSIDMGTRQGAQVALRQIDIAIEKVSSQRSELGAYQNRLEHTVNNLGASEENMTASMSRIQDADMAAEMATFTQQNVLSQAATAMLAQANQRPQQVLQLLQR